MLAALALLGALCSLALGVRWQRMLAMTQDQVSALVEREIANYRYQWVPGLVGDPSSPERVIRELAELRSCLVAPRQTTVQVESYTGEPLRTSDAWVVAESADGTVVVYEPTSQDFWLVEWQEHEGFRTFGVNGDLVGTFMAR